MTSGSGETIEDSWNFERKEDEIVASAAQTLTDRLRELFKADGHIARVIAACERLMERGQQMTNERGPDPDLEKDDGDLARVLRIIAKYGNGARNDYHEAPRGDDGGIKTVVVSVGVALLIAGILGGLALSNQFSAFKAQVTEWQRSTDRRLDSLETHRP